MTKNLIKQPEVNIGLIGHVDHGKTSLLKSLSGIWADTHSEELKRGITIKLGYADASFYYCEKCKKHLVKEKCDCDTKAMFLRKVSFVDAPGHETLMATMLSGAAIMDGALLLIAANEKCPQPQTKEHLMALEIIGVKNIVIAQNKIDLVSEEDAKKNYEEIKKFIKDTIAENAPIIPLSAQHNINISFLIESIENTIKTPKRNLKEEPIMLIARSFDINKPGVKVENLVGGVIGGVLKSGTLKIGQKIEIRPGRKVEKEGKTTWEPILTEISELRSGGVDLKEIIPGGSFGLLTKLDPGIVKSNQLTGSLAGLPGKLPKLWYNLKLKINLLKRVVGAKDELIVESIKKGEILMLNVNTSVTVGTVINLGKDEIEVTLKIPVCADLKDKITISRRLGSRWRLIGFGEIK